MTAPRLRVVQIAHGAYLVKSVNNSWTVNLLAGGGWLIVDHRYERRIDPDTPLGRSLMDAVAPKRAP